MVLCSNNYKNILIPVIFISMCYFIIYLNTNEVIKIENVQDRIEYDFDLCMQDCGRWKTAGFTNISASNVGTCNTQASRRGDNQSVISFTFYGSTTGGRQYFRGIGDNIQLLPKFYPGWVMRIYHNITQFEDVNKLCQLACNFKDDLDICYVGDIPGFGNLFATHAFMWRFLPLVDPQVAYMMSRDLDGRFTAREAAAVSEWLQSGSPLHAMRDHPSHDAEILGGMWGAKVKEYLPIWREAFGKMINFLQNKTNYGSDQKALTNEVFPLANTHPGWLIAHDSYHCRTEKLLKGEMRAFPTQRKMNESFNFVGSHLQNQFLKAECPLPCRKQPDWTYC